MISLILWFLFAFLLFCFAEACITETYKGRWILLDESYVEWIRINQIIKIIEVFGVSYFEYTKFNQVFWFFYHLSTLLITPVRKVQNGMNFYCSLYGSEEKAVFVSNTWTLHKKTDIYVNLWWFLIDFSRCHFYWG